MIAVRLVAGADDLLPRRVRLAEGDVFRDRAAKQPRILQHHAEAAARGGAGIVRDVMAAQQDAAGIDIVEAHEQVHDRGLARAGGSDDGDMLALFHVQVQIPDELGIRLVGEIHMAELHTAVAAGGQVLLDRRFLRQLQQIDDALGSGLGLLQGAQTVGDLLERLRKLPREQHERHDNAHRHALPHDEPAAKQVDGDIGQRIGRGDDRLDDGGQIGRLRLGHAARVVDLCMALSAVLFEIIGLCRRVVRVGLLHDGIQLAGLLEHLVEIRFRPARDLRRQPDGDRHERDHGQRKLPVLQEHHDRDGQDLQKAACNGVEDGMQGAADAGHILRHAREDIADGRVIDKADGQALDLVGDLDAQIAGKIPADSAVEQLHFAVADGRTQKIYAEQRQQPRRELRQHGRARLRRVEIVN